MASYRDNLILTSPLIASRGESLFEEGGVLSLKKEGNRVEGIIRGSGGSYKVSMSFRPGTKNLLSYSCECPYPHFCKHEAAVLCALDKREQETEERSPSSPIPENSDLRFERLLHEFFRHGKGFLSSLSTDFLTEIMGLSSESRLPFLWKRLSLVFEEGKKEPFLSLCEAGNALLGAYSLSQKEKEELLSKVFELEDDLFFRNLASAYFLHERKTNLTFERLFAKRFFLEKEKTLSMLGLVEEIPSGKHDPSFLRLLYLYAPKKASYSLSMSLLDEEVAKKDEEFVYALLLSIYQGPLPHQKAYGLTKELYTQNEEKALSLFGAVLRLPKEAEDILFFLSFLPKEETKDLLEEADYLRFSSGFEIVPFLYGEKGRKEPSPYSLYRARFLFDEERKEKAKELANRYLQRNIPLSSRDDAYAALLLSDNEEIKRNALKNEVFHYAKEHDFARLKAVLLASFKNEGRIRLVEGQDVFL